MNQHDEAREVIETILKTALEADSADSKFEVKILPGLLETALEEIDFWREMADSFSKTIVITAGEVKPRISVDIERFLETQHNYKLATDDLQQRI